MEESAIREGFENLKPGSDYEHLYHSALCRQEADWLVGINGTRLFTVLYGGKVLKVGRVQTPTLAMLVEHESKIMNFKKEQYFMAHILCGGVDAATERIDSKTEAEKIAGACLNGQALVTSVVKEEKTVAPPKLYDLTTLQRDANRLFGFTAKQTLEYTQSLYEKKLCTYPRTDSQYLSDDMEQTAGNVIKAIFSSILFEENMMFNPDIKRVLNSKKVTDHHAIIPTMEIAKADLAALPETERKILSLVANRLLCATGEKHLYETVKAELSCGGYTFAASGKSVLKNGWKDFEDAFKRSFKTMEDKEQEDKKLPELSKGQTFDGVQTKISEHYTTPPKHFTEDSLLSAMERAGNEDMSDDVERKGLGTPATRADIIEKLVQNRYVERQGKYFVPTPKGREVVRLAPDVLKSPELTGKWEGRLEAISKGKEDPDVFIRDIKKMASSLVEEVKNSSLVFSPVFKDGKKCPYCQGEMMKAEDSDGSIHYICQRLSCQYEEKVYKVKVSTGEKKSSKSFVTTPDGKVKVVIKKNSQVKVPVSVYETKTEVVRESKKLFRSNDRDSDKFRQRDRAERNYYSAGDSGGSTMADFFRLSKEREEERRNRKNGKK